MELLTFSHAIRPLAGRDLTFDIELVEIAWHYAAVKLFFMSLRGEGLALDAAISKAQYCCPGDRRVTIGSSR